MKKIVEAVFCDIDYAASKAIVPATHIDVSILDNPPIDICDGCADVIRKLIGELLNPVPALETPEAQPEAQPDTLPEIPPGPGDPGYYDALRAFADAQNPPIKYEYNGKVMYKGTLKAKYASHREAIKRLHNQEPTNPQ